LEGETSLSRSRLIILNSIISIIALYYFTLFKVPECVIDKIDQIRKRFLWAGYDALKQKYHLVIWAIVYRPKEYENWRY
jgi:hypothetical protein